MPITLAEARAAIMDRTVREIVIADPQAENDAPSTYWLDAIVDAAEYDACEVELEIVNDQLVCKIVDVD